MRLAPQLAALDALAASDGHMTKAATALGVPQSTMSRRIHTLEADLGITLLVAEGRTVALTPIAQELAGRARGALHELEHIVATTVTEADPEHGTVRFGFPLTMGSGEMPEIIAAFHRRHPGITLRLKQAHGRELADDLVAGRLDLAVVIPPPDRIEHAILASQEIVVAVPDDHRLAGRAGVPITALRDETFIANPASYHLRGVTEHVCAQTGFTPSVAIEITEFATIRELVGRGLGVALLPRDDAGRADVVEIPLEPALRRDVGLAWGPTARTPAARALSEFVRTQMSGGTNPRKSRSRTT